MSTRASWRIVVPLLLIATAPTTSSQVATFRSDVSIVPIVATVRDAEDRLVPGLAADDFEVVDNGHVEPVAVFESDVTPIAAVLALDTSGSMTSMLDVLKDAAEQFVIRLFPHDRARICVFNDRVGMTDAFTSDRDELAREVRSIDFGNSTRLYDAMAAAIDALNAEAERRVVVVFSDGEDTASHTSQRRISRLARETDTMVYGIGFKPADREDEDIDARRGPDPAIRKMAVESGGGYIEVDTQRTLAATFTRVSLELHSQYLLGIRPAAFDGRIHRISVHVRRPNARVRARRTYVAPAAPRS